MRALFNAKLTHGYLNGCKILDIGTSPARLAGQCDFDGTPLSSRVWSCNPVLDARDHVRQVLHHKSLEKLEASGHHCAHKIQPTQAWLNRQCPVCEGRYDAYMLIDSAYYEDALEGAFHLGAVNRTPVYWVINDYHASLRNGNKTGKACDAESSFVVTKVGPRLSVKVTVNGNILPYEHGIRGTADYCWQYVYNDTDGLSLVVINEIIDKFDNGDTPYIMVRSVAIRAEDLMDSGESLGVANMPKLPLFVADFPQAVEDAEDSIAHYLEDLERDIEAPAAPANSLAEEFSKQAVPFPDSRSTELSWVPQALHNGPIRKDWGWAANCQKQPEAGELEDDDDDDNNAMVVTKLSDVKEVGEYPTNFTDDLAIPEFYHKRLPQAGDKLIDFDKRKEQFKSNCDTWAFVMRNWHSQTEHISIDVRGGRTWVTLTASKKRCGLLCLTDFWGESNTWKAPLDWTIEAYKKLGCKKAIQSIQFTLAECQKSEDFTTVAKICGTNTTALQEAFIIAITIKAQESARLTRACKDIPSLAAYQKTLKNK